MKLSENMRQAGNYLFYSILTTFVGWASYSIFIFLLDKIMLGLELEKKVFIANSLSWFCAVIFSFVANKKRVFKSEDNSFKTMISEIVKFFSSRFAVGLVEIVLVPLLVYIGLDFQIFGVDGLMSKIIVTPILIFLNYLCGKFFVFKK